MPKTGLLVMAYGTPRSLDEVEEYYTDIRHGRPPPPDLLEELKGRYRAIGGRSPLLEITEAQVRGIEQRLDGVPAYLGQKHAAPFISEAVERMSKDGIERILGLVLAPHYSSMSIGDYTRRAQRAAEAISWQPELNVIESWHTEPGYVRWLAARVEEAMSTLPNGGRDETIVIFSAHSLPAAIVRKGDPYPEQLRETAEAVAELGRLKRWQVAWQSAGRTADPWLGPDILEVLPTLQATEGGVVICPCGFVADHLEVLYDIDIEVKQRADELGVDLVRTRAPNDDPEFLDVVAGVVRAALS